MKVSVIIPVYNTAKYLDECIESVVKQSVEELEIILVDDGSTDASSDICDKWANQDERIKVIHKHNEGLGYTRNRGLEEAQGEYISFLDSDDTLDLNTYEICIERMEEYHAQACYFGRKTFDDKGNFTVNANIPKKLYYEGKEIKKEFSKHYIGWLQSEDRIPYIKESSCCAMYRRDIIAMNHLSFPSERECLSEDAFFNLDVCKNADSIIIIPENFYNYRYNPMSLTKKRDKERVRKITGYYHKLQEYIVDFPMVMDAKKRIDFKLISLLRGTVKNEIEASKIADFGEIIKFLKDIVKREDVKAACGSMEEFAGTELDNNTKIFLNWVKNEHVLLMYMFYKMRKVLQ